MPSQRERYPMTPNPDGWYVVALSDDLAPGGVQPLDCLGRELVLFRTESGEARVFDAYYCAGDCPMTYLNTPRVHILQLSKPRASSGGPCCTAAEMSKIRMIHISNDYTLKVVDLDLVVSACGCR